MISKMSLRLSTPYMLLPLVEHAGKGLGVHIGQGGVEEFLVVVRFVGAPVGVVFSARLLLAGAQLEEQVVGGELLQVGHERPRFGRVGNPEAHRPARCQRPRVPR